MSTRRYAHWCAECPTRVIVETETEEGMEDEPEYNAGDGVGVVQVRTPSADDDGLEQAHHCPACGGELHDLDDLMTLGLVKFHEEKDAPEVHAAWRASMQP